VIYYVNADGEENVKSLVDEDNADRETQMERIFF
jgi:hypothetical protein